MRPVNSILPSFWQIHTSRARQQGEQQPKGVSQQILTRPFGLVRQGEFERTTKGKPGLRNVRNAEYNKMWSTNDRWTLDGPFRDFYSAFYSSHASAARRGAAGRMAWSVHHLLPCVIRRSSVAGRTTLRDTSDHVPSAEVEKNARLVRRQPVELVEVLLALILFSRWLGADRRFT